MKQSEQTSPTQEVWFFAANCKHCRRTFAVPHLGDFSYGCFVFHGENGRVFGFLLALTCSAWEDIQSRLLKISGLQKIGRDNSDRLQEVIANCADKIDGQSLWLHPACPFCQSQSLEYYPDNKPVEKRSIPIVTFTEYESLSEAAKMKRLKELWER
jgi:hypothetical protein